MPCPGHLGGGLEGSVEETVASAGSRGGRAHVPVCSTGPKVLRGRASGLLGEVPRNRKACASERTDATSLAHGVAPGSPWPHPTLCVP